MKGIIRFFIAVSMGTCLLILYIHQNVRLIQVSYDIRLNETRLAEVSDEYKQILFELDMLRAPASLEDKIMRANIDLVHPTDVQVIESAQPDPLRIVHHAAYPTHLSFLGKLDFISEAHANSAES